MDVVIKYLIKGSFGEVLVKLIYSEDPRRALFKYYESVGTAFSLNSSTLLGGCSDTGDYDRNKKAFDLLMKEREEIEREIGIQLEWSGPEPSRRAARIMAYYPQPITIEEIADSPETKQKIIERSIGIVRKFKQAFTPRIQRLSI